MMQSFTQYLNEKLDLYYRTYSEAVQAAYNDAIKQGYKIDDGEWFDSVSNGPRKPSEGKTVDHKISLTKNGKPVGKGRRLIINVYNKGGSKPFELNSYIS